MAPVQRGPMKHIVYLYQTPKAGWAENAEPAVSFAHRLYRPVSLQR